jgi:hypothetical protein
MKYVNRLLQVLRKVSIPMRVEERLHVIIYEPRNPAHKINILFIKVFM